MTQGYLPFQYENEPTQSGLTAFAGLPMFLELLQAMRLPQIILENVRVRGAKSQGWTDSQVLVALMMRLAHDAPRLADVANYLSLFSRVETRWNLGKNPPRAFAGSR